MSARSFLIRGLLAGLFAGIAAFGVAYLVGEPSVTAAIAVEESQSNSTQPGGHAHPDPAQPDGHAHADAGAQGSAGEETVVPRSLESTAGLLTGTLVAGVTLGGLVGVLSALALGRFGAAGPRATTLAVTAAGFVSLYLIPATGYPPSPPAVGSGDTIDYRTTLYFLLMAISILALVAALIAGRRLAVRWGGWYASLAGIAIYLVLTVGAIALLPHYDEVPASFPATVLFEFRRASLLTQLALWTVLGVVLADLVGRLATRSRLADPSAQPDPARTRA